MSVDNNADVVIVGAGVIGCLTAYYLSQRGVEVVVIESDGIASGASGSSAGILTPYSGSMAPELLALSPATLDLHAELARLLPDQTGVDYGYELIPHLRLVFTDEGATRLREWQRARADEGLTTEWLEPRQARDLAPWITGEIRGALRCEIEPQLDSYRFVLSVARAAEAKGARFMTGRVIGLRRGAGGAGAVLALENGSAVGADSAVLAMGPWTAHAGDWLGMSIPVAPQRGQILTVQAGEGEALSGPGFGLFAWDVSGVILPKRFGGTILGTTRELVGFDRRVTSEGRRTIIERVLRISSRVESARVVGERACLRPLSLDGRPFIGEVPGWPGVFLATGHGPEGIHFGPVTGLGLAEMIVDGRTRFDLAPFSPSRIAGS